MDRPQFMYSSVDRHFGCFYLLDIMNNAAMNIPIHIFVEHLFSTLLGIYVGMELWGDMFNLIKICF